MLLCYVRFTSHWVAFKCWHATVYTKKDTWYLQGLFNCFIRKIKGDLLHQSLISWEPINVVYRRVYEIFVCPSNSATIQFIFRTVTRWQHLQWTYANKILLIDESSLLYCVGGKVSSLFTLETSHFGLYACHFYFLLDLTILTKMD